MSVPVKQQAEPLVIGLVPATMSEAMALANMMATAKLVPTALQKSPADCLMVIQQAIRWNMDPFAVAQECSVIQGKLMHSGKLVAAVINARGNLADRLSFEYDGEGDERTITVIGRIRSEPEARTVTVKLKDAKTQNVMWQRQPDQQLMYHGSRVWARRHTPELMLGVYSPEEFDDVAAAPRKLSAPNVVLHDPDPPHDPGIGEIAGEPAAPDGLVAVADDTSGAAGTDDALTSETAASITAWIWKKIGEGKFEMAWAQTKAPYRKMVGQEGYARMKAAADELVTRRR